MILYLLNYPPYYSWVDFNDSYLEFLGPIYFESLSRLSPFQIAIPPIPLLIVFSLFSFIPAIYPIPIYFQKRGFENIVYEYQFMKKILYVSIILVIALILLLILFQNKDIMNFFVPVPKNYINETLLESQNLSKTEQLNLMLQYTTSEMIYLMKPFEIFRLLYNIIYFIVPIPIFIVVKFLLDQKRKHFQLFFAKACFKILSKDTINEIDKVSYLMIGLTWYNKFLKRTIHLQIKDLSLVCSKVVFNSPLNKNKILTSISEAFNAKDVFEPLRHISSLFSDKQEIILTEESFKTRIKESNDLIIPIITIIITIITTFFLPEPRLPELQQLLEPHLIEPRLH
jgi:hypothetical protein